ncbi:hypothetical protein [Lacticaseibacillus daqingensis]|uniref:hypothetical protein n=1 Tax=Lacticaseibacillus daqingensis TaxID=2486014 RepID=UPI000F79F953|nr:hypothetical protein [Lacticaseibacillus daqingensis]
MADIKLTLIDQAGTVVATRTGTNQTYLARRRGLARGDVYELTVASAPAFVVVQLDAAVAPALLYLSQSVWRFAVPMDDQREWPYPAGAFKERLGYATARYATEAEINTHRNLAVNSHDQHAASGAFPHVAANAETRGEFVFFARNAIDGMVANESHGNYPFQSWGINEQEDAELTLDFGRPVTLDGLGLVLRADYPHDSYWKQLTVQFSDESQETLETVKTADLQRFDFAPRRVTWLKLTQLVKNPDSATFPALTELETYGYEVQAN